MQIVIDIDDDMYKQIMANDHVYVFDDVNILLIENAIYKGTPLPKKHGDLIDKEVLRNNIHYVPIAPIFQDDYVTYRNVIFADILDMIPTIIEEVKADDE